MRLNRILLVLFACIFMCLAAQANSIYTYKYLGPTYFTIQDPYTSSERLQFTLDFNAPLNSTLLQQVTPLYWSGFDGVNFLSSATCPGCITSFAFGSAAGAIQNWSIKIPDVPLGLSWTSAFSCLAPPGFPCGGDQVDMVLFPIGARTGESEALHNGADFAHSLWSSNVADVPEPPTFLLMVLGLAAYLGRDLLSKVPGRKRC